MKHTLSNWYRNLDFRRKIALICLLSGLFPVLALGGFCYGQIGELLLNREQQALTETVDQAAATLGDRLSTSYHMISYIAWNDGVGQAMERRYDNNFEMFIAYRDFIDPLFATVSMLNKDIVSGTLYTSSNLFDHGETVRPIEEVKQFPWYSKSARGEQPRYYVDSEKQMMMLYSPILSSQSQKENFVCMKIDYKRIFSQLNSLFDKNYGIVLLDKNGNTVYSYQDFDDKSLLLPSGVINASLKDGEMQKKFLSVQHSVASQGWSLTLYRPLGTIYANTTTITLTVLLVAACCTLLLYVLTFFLSKAVVRPLENLTRNMQQIEQGNLAVNLPAGPPRSDEIGVLMKQFRTMVKKLQYLVNEVYKNKIARQDYEIKALQAQINPHFFYNSLSLINSKAILSGQDDISRMAQLLSTFYRTTLNRGHSSISVADEWSNTISYMEIQLMMHSDSFEVFTELDSSVREYIMPNLLLQPLVENAIVHGIDHKVTPGKGRLVIRGCKKEHQLIFTVEDNGCGIEPEKLETLLVTESSGYGVQNVHRRVQLSYGEGYGLVYQSEINSGTLVTLKIPANQPAEKKNDIP
jgi:two-component system sensor histidine kinase YesM